MADYEDLHETEVSEICVQRFKNQEVFVKEDYGFPCGRPRPSSTAEGNLVQEEDVEIEEGDIREAQQKIHVYEWNIYSRTYLVGAHKRLIRSSSPPSLPPNTHHTPHTHQHTTTHNNTQQHTTTHHNNNTKQHRPTLLNACKTQYFSYISPHFA